MGQRVELRHEVADGLLVEFLEITGPVVLVAQSPENHGWMIVMLVDEVAEHVAGLISETLAAETTAAPWDFLPD